MSSAPYFEGWSDWIAKSREHLRGALAQATCWLLREGWKRAGELRLRPLAAGP